MRSAAAGADAEGAGGPASEGENECATGREGRRLPDESSSEPPWGGVRTETTYASTRCGHALRTHGREAHTFWATKKGAVSAPTLATQRLQLWEATHRHNFLINYRSSITGRLL